jgi:dATP pyrophosphohydrolase
LSRYKRPESVLVVIHTATGEVLVLRRCQPPDFWQSVTGSLRWEEIESAGRGATGIARGNRPGR